MPPGSGIDWNHEALTSLLWTLKVVGISAVGFLAVAFLLARYTKWGRQFWQVSGRYYTTRASWRPFALLAVILFITILGVRINVLLSYRTSEMYTALQTAAQAFASGDADTMDASKDAFWKSMVVFGVLATIHVVRSLLAIYVGQAFEIHWRVWLNDRVATDWLTGDAYYRNRFVDQTIDNPDQRIEADTGNMITSSRTLSFGLVSALVSLWSFTQILWELSGPITILGIEIPRAMLFLALFYVLVSTLFAFWIGRPLIKLNFLNERLTANFRYALVRVRDSAESIAFYRGEGVERNGLLTRFAAIIKNYWAIVFRTLKFSGFNLVVNQISAVFAFVIQAPRFFAGTITLGDLSQSATAFEQVHDSLSYFRESYDQFAEYRASLIRLSGLINSDDKSRKLSKLEADVLEEGLEIEDVQVRRPDGGSLIDGLSLRLVPGDTLVVKGPSGVGKTTLLRSLSEMWPFADGMVRRPEGSETMFLSQIPYLPLGDLRTAVAYPAKPDDLGDDQIRETLQKVQLGHLAGRLDEEADWAKILSPGEQQRVAFARIVLIKPSVVFLDEATSAVDEGLEFALYSLLREEVPRTILFSVSHRSTVDQHHTQQLDLLGSGPWRVSDTEPGLVRMSKSTDPWTEN